MAIKQGTLYWVELPAAVGSEPGFRRPCLVIQNDLLNQSRIHTVVVCVLTSSLQRAKAPGNVLIQPRESGLKQPSVINVTQLVTVNKTDLIERIGTLTPKRLQQVIDGLHFLIEPQEIADDDDKD